MQRDETAGPILRIRGLTKEYRIGAIGGLTLREALARRAEARKACKAEPAEGQGRRLQGDRLLALRDVSFDVMPGEAVGIIGRNGAGKSTLLKLICRITAPTAGGIDLYGSVASMLEVGTGFHGEMTGRENVYLNGAILGMSRAEVAAKMEDIIEFSEIRDFIDTPVKRYSSGMYVKLAFSVAAHLDSDIIIMDEVLAVGDMEFQKKCLEKMRDAARSSGRTVLYVSHNMHTIRALCSRCIVLDEGRVVFDGDVGKAIGIYLGTANAGRTLYTFGPEYRPYDSVLRLHKRFAFETLEVLGGRDGAAVFRSGRPEALEVTCRAYRPLQGVYLRLEFWHQDGTKAGTAFSSSGLDLPEGEHRLSVTLDTSHLAPGQWSADMVAYCRDESGSEDILDGVYPGIVFQVEARLEDTAGLDWHLQYWGGIHLHDLEVKRL